MGGWEWAANLLGASLCQPHPFASTPRMANRAMPRPPWHIASMRGKMAGGGCNGIYLLATMPVSQHYHLHYTRPFLDRLKS